MRSVGTLEAPSVRPGSHVCWGFEKREEFHEAATAFLAEGLERHERLVYVADASEARMRADVASFADVDRLVGDAHLVLVPVGRLYDGRYRLDPLAQVDRYHRMVAAALDDGHSGLRVAAEATGLVTDLGARRRFIEYEVAVDRLMSLEPMTAMCAYDRTALGPAVAELFAVHPLTHGADDAGLGLSAFYDGGALHLAGEVDAASHELFQIVVAALERAPDVEPVIDLGGCTFMDVASLTQLWMLSSRLEQAGRELRVTRPPEIIRRCCEVLEFDSLSKALVAR